MIPVRFINRNTYSRKIQKNKHETEAKLRSYAFLPMKDLFEHLSTTQAGLTSEEVERRQNEFGKNVIIVGNKNTALRRLRDAIINPFNIILLLIAVITYFTDVIASESPDYLTVVIILALVLLSGLVAFIQRQRSDASIEKL